ncbi:MAG: YHYH protein, partial [Methylococcaceae bacterium]|nr:YHYH protein [Methylococcaceae bacterium]
PNPADGPIAVAINGVPIFDPSKQDGRHDEEHDPNIIGELDICGGHAGRGDDYHYHTAPKCLINSLKNTKQPIAYALDGYPLYGFLDANEQKFVKLDECNGRKTKEGGYQYHSTEDFPYINACFKGLVDLRHRPRTENIRMHGLPIRANIYDYEQLSKNSYRLSYRYKGKNIQINYKKYDEDCYLFHFSDDNRREIYCANKPEKTKKAALTPPPPPKKTNFKKTDKAVVSYISKAAKTLEINEQKLRDSMGKPPYDYKRISERLKVDEGLLHDALGIKRPRHLRKNKR